MSKAWRNLHAIEVARQEHLKNLDREELDRLKEELKERQIDAIETSMAVDVFFKSGRTYEGL